MSRPGGAAPLLVLFNGLGAESQGVGSNVPVQSNSAWCSPVAMRGDGRMDHRLVLGGGVQHRSAAGCAGPRRLPTQKSTPTGRETRRSVRAHGHHPQPRGFHAPGALPPTAEPAGVVRWGGDGVGTTIRVWASQAARIPS